MIKAFLRRQTMQFIVTHSAQTAHNTKHQLHLERCPAGGLGHALDGLHGAVQRDAGRGVRGGRGGGAEQQQQRQHGDTERAADTLTLQQRLLHLNNTIYAFMHRPDKNLCDTFSLYSHFYSLRNHHMPNSTLISAAVIQ